LESDKRERLAGWKEEKRDRPREILASYMPPGIGITDIEAVIITNIHILDAKERLAHSQLTGEPVCWFVMGPTSIVQVRMEYI
jgi:hypothetical protein